MSPPGSGRARAPFGRLVFPHRQRDALAGDVHVHDGDEHFLMNLDHFVGIADEAVRQLADVDEPNAPNAVMLVTMPGSFMPGLRSCRVLTPSAKEKGLNGPRGSRPGFSSSFMMSVSVGRPSVSVTYRESRMDLRSSGLSMRSRTVAPASLAMRSTTG